jgi:hypothetical protein
VSKNCILLIGIKYAALFGWVVLVYETYISNQALLGKWFWRYANENEALWYKIIKAKYDEQEGGWCSKEVSGEEICWPNSSHKTSSIREGCPLLINMRKILSTSNVRLFLNTLPTCRPIYFLVLVTG